MQRYGAQGRPLYANARGSFSSAGMWQGVVLNGVVLRLSPRGASPSYIPFLCVNLPEIASNTKRSRDCNWDLNTGGCDLIKKQTNANQR